VAALVTFLFAISSSCVEAAVEGLRNEEVTILLLLVVWGARRATEENARAREFVCLGLALGLASLTYISLLFTCLLALFLFFLKRKASLKKFVLVAVLACVLVLPHLAHNAKTFGDPLFSLNYHARFYRNLELQGRPGYPTVREVEKDPYAGAPTTAFRYMWVDHTPVEAVTIGCVGVARLLTHRAPFFNAYRPYELGFFVWGLVVACMGVILFRAREKLFVVLFAGILALPIVFPLGTFVAMEPRLVNQFLWVWLWAVSVLGPGRGGGEARSGFTRLTPGWCGRTRWGAVSRAPRRPQGLDATAPGVGV
jgi:hypothetical protein